MKANLQLSVLLPYIIFYLFTTIIKVDAKISITHLQPNSASGKALTMHSNTWITFMAMIETIDDNANNNNCAIETIDLHAYGHAITEGNFETRESIDNNCPPDYYCKDVLFTGKGSNWWYVLASDSCGNYEQTDIRYLCIQDCPMYEKILNTVSSSSSFTWLKCHFGFKSKILRQRFVMIMKHVLIFGAIAINGHVY